MARAPVGIPALKKILSIDVGGTKVKLLASGETEPRKFASGGKLTPARMVEKAKEVAKGWRYDVNFAAAFGCPVRMTSDASMQALGSYDGGRMLFIGLGSAAASACGASTNSRPSTIPTARAQRCPSPPRGNGA